MQELIKPMPPALPTTVSDFLTHRALKAQRTLNDQIEEIHLALYENEKYRRLLDAVYDTHAVEGKTQIDDTLAAQMIREKADKIGHQEVAKEKLAVIQAALGVVLRRYRFSRKQRRNMVAGEIIPGDDNGENGD